jgi:hypothetical protein
MNNHPDPNEGTRNWNCLVRLEDGVPVEIDNKPFGWITDSNVRPSDEYLAWAGYYEYVKENLTYDSKKEKVVEYDLTEAFVDHDSKKVIVKQEVVPLTDEEIETLKESEINRIRGWRNDALKNSDWTQSLDHPEEFRKKWASYRQILRDIPNNLSTNNVFNFKFPEPPVLGHESTDPVIENGNFIHLLKDNK